MRAHIHFDLHGRPQSTNCYVAMDGRQQIGRVTLLRALRPGARRPAL